MLDNMKALRILFQKPRGLFMKDLIFENWRRYLIENAPQQIFYTGAVLDPDTVKTLASEIPEVLKKLGLNQLSAWDVSQIGSHGHEQLNHHMTFGASANAKLKPPIDQNMLNKPIEIQIIGFGYDEKLGVAAWQVKSALDSHVQTRVPHITAMVQPGVGKVFNASKITNWQPVQLVKISGNKVQGVITEVVAKG